MIYETTFYISLICPQGINYHPCTEGSEGVIILKDLISRTFNNIEQNRYIEILIGCVLDKGITYNPCPECCGGVFFSKIGFLYENQIR
jgi:hypothetical protein